VDERWKLAEFADEEAVGCTLWVAGDLRVDFDGWISITEGKVS
jgi:hypothetical protein